MSRVANSPVVLPKGVESSIAEGVITIKGPLGSLTQRLNSKARVALEDGRLVFSATDDEKISVAHAGTTRALVANMVKGVTAGFEKKLTMVGVGYRAQAQGNKINLSLGFSHPVEYVLPAGIKAELPTQTELIIRGADKQQVGQVAAEIRAYRPPEPYKGKGVRYSDETVILKETKKK